MSDTFEQSGGRVANALAVKYRFTSNQAAGIVGNLGYESMGFKTLQEIKPMIPGSRGGYGWAQWTGTRRRAFEEWCAKAGLKPSGDEANFGFLCVEMEGSHAYCVRNLRKEVSLENCVFRWGHDFEAPAGTTSTNLPGFKTRLNYARRALAGIDISSVPTRVFEADIPPPDYGDTPTLRLGDSGPAVARLQSLLQATGYSLGPADGYLSLLTKNALVAFQRAHGLAPDGVAGPATWAKLLA